MMVTINIRTKTKPMAMSLVIRMMPKDIMAMIPESETTFYSDGNIFDGWKKGSNMREIFIRMKKKK